MSKERTTKSSLFARTSKVVAALCPPVLLAALALVNQGVPLSQLDLNDGSVWLTSNAELKMGRYNPRIDELDAGLVASSGKFDVQQEGNDVLLVEPTALSVVDVSTVAVVHEVPVPANADVQLRAGQVSIIDSETGDMWLEPVERAGGVNTEADSPITLGPNAGGVLAESGRLLTVTESGETARYRRTSEGDLSVRDTGHLGEGGAGQWEDLTAVGDQIVGLRDGQVYLDGATVDVGPGEAVLQRPGPESDVVLVALEDRLVAVPLSGGQPREISRVSPGTPAAPVIVDGCRHAAWAANDNNYVYDCDESSHITPITLEDVTSADELVFRVNRSVVVLNDVRSGRLWVPQEDVQARDPNWQDIVPEEEPEETDDTTGDPSAQSLRAECTENSPAPSAVDDSFGVRAGRTRTLPVLANDSTSDCGILVISEFDEVPSSFGELELVAGGRALQLTVAPNATGSAQFTYTVTDGRGSSTPSTATVDLTVRPAGQNAPPEQDRVGTLTLEQGGEGTYNILSDFSDPDGDDLFIADAYSTSTGAVRFRPDGQITFVAEGDDLGRREVRVVVSDGIASIEGSLNVDVRPPGSLAPQIDPLHEVAYVDEVITIEPLRAVRTVTAEPATLASVEEPAGTEVHVDSQSDSFTFSSSQAGTYYVPFSVVAMPHEAIGLVRIDVKEREEEPSGPLAVRDIAMLRPGGEVTIDPLANDIDPTRGVLVLQSVDVPDGSGLRVGILNHRLLQISATRVLEEPVTFTYQVSNGFGEAEGEVIVLPVPASETQRAPVVPDVKVSVRTGGVVTIPVLEDAYDPDGDPLTLEQELPEPLPAGEGLLFVSGDLLRYQAPDRPLTTHAVFAVSDSDGNTTSAQLTVTVHESDPETKAPPRPKDLTARVFAGESVRIPIPLVGIDRDGDGVVLLGQAEAPLKGRIIDTGADWIEYEALPGESGLDTFTYAVEDWVGQRAVARVQVGIAPRPTSSAQVIARDDEVTVRPGELVEVRVLGNDIDAAGGELTLSPNLEHEPDVNAWVEGRRVFVQTDAKQDGSVLQIVYEVTNDRGGRDTAVLTVRVESQAPLLPPIARDVVVPAADTIDRTSIEVDVLEVAENPSGSRQDLRVSVPESAAENAVVTAARTIVVTLAESSQTIPYRLTNTKAEGSDLSSYAFITVPALGDYPPMQRPRAPRLTVVAGEELLIPLAEQVKVAPGKKAQITSRESVSATRSDGSDLLEDFETLRFKAPRNYAGPASISFEVTDGQRGDLTAGIRSFTLPITVYAAEDNPPKFSPSTVEVAPGEDARSIDLNAFTSSLTGDAEENSYRFTIDGSATSGFNASISDSRLLVSADLDAARGTTGSVDIEIDYGGSGIVRGTVPLRVVASSRPLARVLDHEVTDAVEGRNSSVAVLEGAYNPFPDSALSVIDAVVETPNAGTASVQGSNVVVRPDDGFIGTMTTRYRVVDGTGDRDRQVEGRIRVRVRGVPDAPSRPRVREVRDRTVVLSWDAPTANGEPIDRYRVTRTPGGDVTECRSTTCTIEGLTNDTTYRFRVEAHNEVGWSESSSESDEARPDTKPNRPDAPELEFGDGQIKATWTAPESPGSPVKNYQLQISPAPSGGGAVNTSSKNYTFTGLQNGTQYTVRVRAENDAPDPSDWSESAHSTPARAPDAPSVTASKEADKDSHTTGGKITASWERPASNGDAITEYQIQVTGGDLDKTETVGADVRNFTLPDAKNGVSYTFKVRAKNKAGWSEYGQDSTKRHSLPAQVDAPTVTAGAIGSGEINVSWNAPDSGGAPITEYEVRGTRDGYEKVHKVAAGTGRTVKFAKLDGGKDYAFEVRARNDAGWGAWSSKTTGSTTTPPGEPKLTLTVTEGDIPEVEVTWSDVDTGGAGTPNYTVSYAIDGGSEKSVTKGSGNSATIKLTAMDPGEAVSVEVRVKATNSGGSKIGKKSVTVERQVPVPTDLDVTVDYESDTTIDVTWSAAPDISMYRISWKIGDQDTKSREVSGTSAQLSASDGPFIEGQTVKVSVRSLFNGKTSDPVSKTIEIEE